MPPGEGFRSPEFELVLACVRWPLTPADAARALELASRPINWQLLLKIVEHHHVASLVSRSLQVGAPGRLPPEPLSDLRKSAFKNARDSFRNISEMVRLTRVFSERSLDFRVLKGAPLAMTAFGDPTLRGAGDLDLLIREADIPAADRILRDSGYVRCEPEAWATPRRMRSYVAHQKDFTYDHPGNSLAIDLHWRLFRNRWLATNAGLDDAGLAWTQFGTEHIPTLPLNRLFLYLCVHGSLDGWLRLKWLADINALLGTLSPEDLSEIFRAARVQRVLPEVSAAVLLCNKMLGFPLPGGCLGADEPAVSRILRFAGSLMTLNDCCPERERIPSTKWFLNEFLSSPSLRSRAELLERSLFRPRAWGKIPLPDALFPLYALLSPAEWVAFRLKRWTRSLARRAKRPNPEFPQRTIPHPRLLGRSPSDLALLIEAGSMLAFFRIALRFFSVQRLTAWMGNGARPERSFSADDARQILRKVEWAVGAVARHSPFTFVCFPQSLAAYFMLRRRDIPSKLFYGVAREGRQLKAHTWIKVGDRTVVGGDSEPRFTILAIFP